MRAAMTLQPFALLVFVAGAVACGGDAFTSDGADAAVDATPMVDGAPPRDAGPGDAGFVDAGPPLCASLAGSHTFCEDFTGGVPGAQMIETVSGGGVLTADTRDYRSAPQSMLATTPRLTDKIDAATSIVSKAFNGAPGTQLSLSLDLEVDPTCETGNNGDFVSIVALSFPESNFEMAIGVTQNGVALIDFAVDADGGLQNGGASLHSPQTTALPSGWQTWAITVNGGAINNKTVSVTVGGQSVYAMEKLSHAPSPGALQHPTLILGASVKNMNGHSAGCAVHVDNVLFDIRPGPGGLPL